MSVAPVLQVLTASRLTDGIAVFCGSDGTWTPDILGAAGAQDDTARRALEVRAAQAVDDQHVVDPYFIDVTESAGTFQPVRLRERIRASGPTVGQPAISSQAYAVGD